MAEAEITIDRRWTIRIEVDQVSQDPKANQSTVRVIGRVRTALLGSSGHIGVEYLRSLSGDISWGPQSYVFEAGYIIWYTLIDHTAVVTHNLDGTKHINVTFNFAPKIPNNQDSGGSVSVGLTLSTIPRPPEKNGITNVRFNNPSEVIVNWSEATSTSWDPVTQYELEWRTIEGPGAPNYSTYGSDVRSATISVSGSTSGYLFRVRARNGPGWGPFSDTYTAELNTLPTAPSNLSVVYTSESSGTVSFSAPSSMGPGTLRHYEIQRAFTHEFREVISTYIPTTSGVIDNLYPGATLYLRVRAVSSEGAGYWSSTLQTRTPSGPSVKIGKDWKPTVAYVKVGSAWKVAVPYIWVNGQWRLASS